MQQMQQTHCISTPTSECYHSLKSFSDGPIAPSVSAFSLWPCRRSGPGQHVELFQKFRPLQRCMRFPAVSSSCPGFLRRFVRGHDNTAPCLMPFIRTTVPGFRAAVCNAPLSHDCATTAVLHHKCLCCRRRAPAGRRHREGQDLRALGAGQQGGADSQIQVTGSRTTKSMCGNQGTAMMRVDDKRCNLFCQAGKAAAVP